VERSEWVMILGLDRNICEMLIWNRDMRRFVPLKLL